MEIILNHQSGLAETEPGSRLGRVLDELKIFLATQHLVLTGLALDGEELGQEREILLRDRLTEDFSRLEVSALPADGASHQLLSRLAGCLPAWARQAVSAAHAFQAAQVSQGYQLLGRLTSDLGSLQEGLGSISKLTPGVVAGSAGPWITKLRDILARLSGYLEAKDIVALGDLLEYELAAHLRDGVDRLRDPADGSPGS